MKPNEKRPCFYSELCLEAFIGERVDLNCEIKYKMYNNKFMKKNL